MVSSWLPPSVVLLVVCCTCCSLAHHPHRLSLPVRARPFLSLSRHLAMPMPHPPPLCCSRSGAWGLCCLSSSSLLSSRSLIQPLNQPTKHTIIASSSNLCYCPRWRTHTRMSILFTCLSAQVPVLSLSYSPTLHLNSSTYSTVYHSTTRACLSLLAYTPTHRSSSSPLFTKEKPLQVHLKEYIGPV